MVLLESDRAPTGDEEPQLAHLAPEKEAIRRAAHARLRGGPRTRHA